MGREVIPLIVAASSLIMLYKYKTQLENAIIGEGRFGLQAISQNDMTFVAKRLASLIRYQYTMGSQSLPSSLIEV